MVAVELTPLRPQVSDVALRPTRLSSRASPVSHHNLLPPIHQVLASPSPTPRDDFSPDGRRMPRGRQPHPFTVIILLVVHFTRSTPCVSRRAKRDVKPGGVEKAQGFLPRVPLPRSLPQSKPRHKSVRLISELHPPDPQPTCPTNRKNISQPPIATNATQPRPFPSPPPSTSFSTPPPR